MTLHLGCGFALTEVTLEGLGSDYPSVTLLYTSDMELPAPLWQFRGTASSESHMCPAQGLGHASTNQIPKSLAMNLFMK